MGAAAGRMFTSPIHPPSQNKTKQNKTRKLNAAQDAIFEESTYILDSNSGVINLEVPIGALHRALRSAIGASSAQIRLTKKGNVPLLALTILSSSWTTGSNAIDVTEGDPHDDHGYDEGSFSRPPPPRGTSGPRERETVISQEVPVKVLHESAVDGLHEPRCPDPEVHIILPSLIQLKSISERFTRLATIDTKTTATTTTTTIPSSSAPPAPTQTGSRTSPSPKLELSANMHGSLKLAIVTDSLRISSVWTDLVNPPLDPAQLSQTEIEQLPSERMRAMGDDEEAGWARVRIDGKDWGRVLSVGRLSPKVVACECPMGD